jgi:hypothetical protein
VKDLTGTWTHKTKGGRYTAQPCVIRLDDGTWSGSTSVDTTTHVAYQRTVRDVVFVRTEADFLASFERVGDE